MTKITIAVLTFNSAQTIERCLDAIYAQSLPRTLYDVLVLDNGSSDATLHIVGRYPCSVLVCPEKTISELRNLAVATSQAPLIAFVDSDCVIPPNWLQNALPWLDAPLVAVAGCKYKPPPNASRFERNWYGSPSQHLKHNDLIPAGNMVLRKSTFLALGGFDPTLITGEDAFFLARVRRNGYVAINDPSLSSIHLGNPKSLREFFKKEIWYGLGNLNPKTALTLRDRPFLTAHLVLFLLLVVIISTVGGAYRIALASFLLCLGVILASAFHRRYIKQVTGSFWYMALAYVVYYFARIASLLYVYKLKRVHRSSPQRPSPKRVASS